MSPLSIPLAISSLALLCCSLSLQAQDERQILANTSWAKLSAAHRQSPVLVIKFKEDSAIRLNAEDLQLQNPASVLNAAGLNASQLNHELGQINRRFKQQKLKLSRSFQLDDDQLQRLKAQGERRKGRKLADLGLYFEVRLDNQSDAQKQQLIEFLNQQQAIEQAYLRPMAEPASIEVSSTTPNLQSHQGYLNAPPNGINAINAWNLAGGRGNGVKIVDVEGGWRTSHEDLPALFFQFGVPFEDLGWRNHGTAVMGVIGAKHNGYGVSGIADQSQLGYSSIGSYHSVASAILTAGNAVGPGGIVLIELHASGPADASACTCNQGQCNYVAMEYWQENFDAIQTLTANGVIVVEAAGNGDANFDDPVYNRAFNRSFRDSGAIMVGASLSSSRTPACFSNHGSRIDLHGWGENVATTGYGGWYGTNEDNWYTPAFSGTSSASPIVVGAAASLQGIALSQSGQLLTPNRVRALLANTGTVQTAQLNKAIGPLPNITAAAAQLANRLQRLPQLHLRRQASNWQPEAMTLVDDNLWQIELTLTGLPSDAFKFDVHADWSQNLGDSNQDGLADANGAPIPLNVSAGAYQIRYNDLTQVIQIKPIVSNQAPVANAGANQRLTQAGTVQLNGSASFDPDGQIVSYQWRQIAGPWLSLTNADKAIANLTLGAPQSYGITYHFSLTVTDNQNRSSSSVVQIELSPPATDYQRTVVFIYGQTQGGQDMFIRGGLDHGYAQTSLGRSCTEANKLCAIPIRHRNLKNATTNPWKTNDTYLDWYGVETGQSTAAQGSPLDWTTNIWPASWGTKRTVSVDGYGETSLNLWGQHYWMLDVDMDCSKTVNGWFELKSFISNGPGWEGNVSQAGAPYQSGNHFAQCGKLNMFKRGESSASITNLP